MEFSVKISSSQAFLATRRATTFCSALEIPASYSITSDIVIHSFPQQEPDIRPFLRLPMMINFLNLYKIDRNENNWDIKLTFKIIFTLITLLIVLGAGCNIVVSSINCIQRRRTAAASESQSPRSHSLEAGISTIQTPPPAYPANMEMPSYSGTSEHNPCPHDSAMDRALVSRLGPPPQIHLNSWTS